MLSALKMRLSPSSMPANWRIAIIQRLLCHRIADRIPVLEEIYAQHRPQRHGRRSTPRFDLRLMRPDQSQHTRPRHNRIHLGEKLTQRLLLLHRVEETGKGGRLGHRRGSIVVPDRVSQIAQQARFFRRSLMMQPVNKKGENPMARLLYALGHALVTFSCVVF